MSVSFSLCLSLSFSLGLKLSIVGLDLDFHVRLHFMASCNCCKAGSCVYASVFDKFMAMGDSSDEDVCGGNDGTAQSGSDVCGGTAQRARVGVEAAISIKQKVRKSLIHAKKPDVRPREVATHPHRPAQIAPCRLSDKEIKQASFAARHFSESCAAICWDHFQGTTDADSALRICIDLASTQSVIKVGVTTSPIWRWVHCRNHETMIPHSDAYDTMHVLMVDVGGYSGAMEETLISDLRRHPSASPKLANVLSGYDGPIEPLRATFLYLVSR